jgi:hypothetical protein
MEVSQFIAYIGGAHNANQVADMKMSPSRESNQQESKSNGEQNMKDVCIDLHDTIFELDQAAVKETVKSQLKNTRSENYGGIKLLISSILCKRASESLYLPFTLYPWDNEFTKKAELDNLNAKPFDDVWFGFSTCI